MKDERQKLANQVTKKPKDAEDEQNKGEVQVEMNVNKPKDINEK